MSNQAILDSLQSALVSERNLSLCLRNTASTLSWSGLSDKKRQQVAETLERLAMAPAQRGRKIQELIDHLNRSS